MKRISISAISETETIMAMMKRSGFCALAAATPTSSATTTMIRGRTAISR